MGVPVSLLGESLIDAVIEVLVVREDNVATDIVKLNRKTRTISVLVLETFIWRVWVESTYETLRRGIGGSKTARLLVGINNQPRRAILKIN